MAMARPGGKSAEAFRTISEVADELDVPQHVLRFWETKFSQVRPLKRGGGRRYYRPEDIALLQRIRGLLYDDGYTIKGVQKLFKGGQVKASGRKARASAGGAALVKTDASPTREAAGADAGVALSKQDRALLGELMTELAELRDLLRNSGVRR